MTKATITTAIFSMSLMLALLGACYNSDGTDQKYTLTGNVSTDFAQTYRTIQAVDSNDNVTTLATTDDSGNFSTQLDDDLDFPTLVYAETAEGVMLSSLLVEETDLGDERNINLNPITTLVANELLAEDATSVVAALQRNHVNRATSRLIANSLNDITSASYLAVARQVVAQALGNSVTYDQYFLEEYTAATAGNPAAGNFQNIALAALQQYYTTEEITEVLNDAIDGDNPRFDGNSAFLNDNSFQAVLVGLMYAQGRSGDEIVSLLAELNSTTDTVALQESVSNLISIFESYKASAQGSSSTARNGLTVGITDETTLQESINSFARMVAENLASSCSITDTQYQNILDNSYIVGSNSLINMALQNEGVEGLETLFNIVSQQLAITIENTGANLSISDLDTATISTQIDNFSQALLPALINSYQNDTANLNTDLKTIFFEHLAFQVTQSMTPYLADKKVEVSDTATNVSETLTTALGVALGDLARSGVDAGLSENILEQLINSTAKGIRRRLQRLYSTDLKNATNLATLVNVANNFQVTTLATAVASQDAIADLTDEQQAVIIGVLTELVSTELQDQDLSGALPDEAVTLASNIATVVTPALVTNVAQESNRIGNNLWVMMKYAAGTILSDLESNGIVLTSSLTQASQAVNTAQESASEAAIAVEDNYQVLSDMGLNLSDMTNVIVDKKLAAGAVLVVISQIRDTLTDPGDLTTDEQTQLENLRSKLPLLTSTMVATAEAFINKGEDPESDNLIEGLAFIMSALVDSEGQSESDCDFQPGKSIKVAIDSISQSDLGVSDTLASMKSISSSAAIATTSEKFKSIVDTVQTQVAQNLPVALADLETNAETLAEAQTKQSTLTTQAAELQTSAAAIKSTVQVKAEEAVQQGQTLSAFNTTTTTTTTLPPATVTTATVTTRPPSTVQNVTFQTTQQVVTTVPITVTTITLPKVTTTTLPPTFIPQREAVLESLVLADSPYVVDYNGDLSSADNYCGNLETHYEFRNLQLTYEDKGTAGVQDTSDTILIQGTIAEVGTTTELAVNMSLVYDSSIQSYYAESTSGETRFALALSLNFDVRENETEFNVEIDSSSPNVDYSLGLNRGRALIFVTEDNVLNNELGYIWSLNTQEQHDSLTSQCSNL